jgi:hypothetical protein
LKEEAAAVVASAATTADPDVCNEGWVGVHCSGFSGSDVFPALSYTMLQQLQLHKQGETVFTFVLSLPLVFFGR